MTVKITMKMIFMLPESMQVRLCGAGTDKERSTMETEQKATKIMTATDFLNLPTVDLMGWWLYHESGSGRLHCDPEDFARVIAAYDAYGREGIAAILGDAGYSATEDELPKVIGLAAAKGLLTKMKNNHDSRIFSAVFVKRTDGTLRHMQCRYDVKKYLKGGEQAYEPKEHDLTCVFDINAAPRYNAEEKVKIAEGKMKERPAGDYRSINLEHLIRLSIGGKQYIIEENKDLVNLLKD
jgi:hypothetical protein